MSDQAISVVENIRTEVSPFSVTTVRNRRIHSQTRTGTIRAKANHGEAPTRSTTTRAAIGTVKYAVRLIRNVTG